MKISTPFYIACFLGMSASPVSAQITSTVKNDMAKVDSGLMPAVRFVGEPLWTIESRMKHYNIPGVSIAVIKNSKVIWSKTYGFADGESKVPVTTQTLFQAASMSKTLSAYAALKEVEMGKLDPDADVNSYLKSWKIPENEFTKQKKVSLKNILSHTAGFTGHGFSGYETGQILPTLLQVLNGQSPANSPAVFVDKIPGSSFRYSGGGYTVMQQMLMDIEGKDYVTIMKESVLVPLDMKNSTFTQPLPTAQAQLAASAYTQDGARVQGRYHVYPELAAAALWTTAEDLAKFVIDLQNTLSNKSHKVISQKAAEQMTTPFIDPFEGLGVFLENKGGHVYFSHGGDNEGFSGKFIGNKTSGDGLIILTNANKPAFIEELIRSVAGVYNWPDYNAPVDKILLLTQQDLKSNNGRYQSEKYGFYKVYSEKGKLMLIHNVESPTELIKVEENTYAMRDWDFKAKFVKNSKTGKLDLLMILPDGSIRSENPQIGNDVKAPLELILEGQFEKGIQAYQKAKTDDSNHNLFSEDYLNRAGYALLQQKEVTKAIDVFRVNTLLYPASENVYDSLGEAYLEAGQKDKARQNYQKVLELNPQNESVRKILQTF
jgi:CubicO group peptidase (beta-lactamase class C family)